MWKTFNNKHIDNLEETILTDIANTSTNDLTFIVGADSQWSKGRVTYTVVIIMLMNGKGGKGYHKTIVTDRNQNVSIKQRLFTETYQAVEVAMWLNPILEQLGFEVSEVHIDIATDKHHKSYEMLSTCMGYVKGMNFNCKAKPDSWAASCTADKFTK